MGLLAKEGGMILLTSIHSDVFDQLSHFCAFEDLLSNDPSLVHSQEGFLKFLELRKMKSYGFSV